MRPCGRGTPASCAGRRTRPCRTTRRSTTARGEQGRAAYCRQYGRLERAGTDEFRHLPGPAPVPTRIIRGREDGFLAPPIAERPHALIPHSELHWVEGAGHAIQQEDAPPRLLALLTREFPAAA